MILDTDGIMRVLPHRYPFLMVDRVLELEKNKRIKALKAVTVGEPHFQGHFPTQPLMPGVLIIEALAQTCALLAVLSAGLKEFPKDTTTLLAGVDNCRFRRIIKPGDSIFLHSEIVAQRRALGFMRCQTYAEVDGTVVCAMTITNVKQ